ncbi:hypothetical protein ACFRMQ_14540 [Kitasatospora sp. NPDC056783]|uniref:hypothetical protein n=1 Tax=Kitasatospora sp. NPDC056783 TaxID=3345943 RepID=UPI0036BC1D85
MRRRLRAAVQFLLAEPAMQGAGDLDRLLRIIVVAKANSDRMYAASSTAAELGRWAGVGASSIDQALARQRAAGTLITRQRRAATGVIGLDVGIPAMIDARRAGDLRHPLALQRRELAVLLRLLEVLFAPGWRHADRAATPGGVLVGRTGRGAATDRLGLLLLALEARSDGTVRLCGGRVDQRRGRSAVTLARLLGCTPDGAAKVLTRLQQHGALELIRRATKSGLLGRGGIRIPVVAAGPSVPRAVPRPDTKGCDDRPGAATRGTTPPQGASSQVSPSGAAAVRAIAERSAAEDLHAPHAVAADVPETDEVVEGFSGEAENGVLTVAGGARAHARIPAPQGGRSDERCPGEPSGALRAENPMSNRSSSVGPGRALIAPAGLVTAPVREVLAEIAPLVDRLDERERRVASQAVARVLRVRASADLIDHLVARLAPMSFDGPPEDRGVIRSPLAWFLSQLPQVTVCGECGRTLHGAPGHFGNCDHCAAGPAAAATGVCPGCGRYAEIFAMGECAGCEHESAITASSDRAVRRAATAGAAPREAAEVAAAVRRAAAEAAEAAEAAGAQPAFVRLAARLAADTFALPTQSPGRHLRMVAPASGSERGEPLAFR